MEIQVEIEYNNTEYLPLEDEELMDILSTLDINRNRIKVQL